MQSVGGEMYRRRGDQTMWGGLLVMPGVKNGYMAS